MHRARLLAPGQESLAAYVLPIIGVVLSVLGLIIALAMWLGSGPELPIALFSVVISLIIGIFSNLLTNVIRKRVIRTPNIFLSYPHQDSSTAHEIAEKLRQAGAKVWIDVERLQPGQDITSEVEGAISDSDAFVALLSGVSKPWGLRELEIAKDKGIKIVPILLEGADLPSIIKDIYYIDFSKDKPEKLAELVKAVT